MSGMVAQAAPDFKCLNKNCLSKYIYIYIYLSSNVFSRDKASYDIFK